MEKKDWSDSLKDLMDRVDDFMSAPETKRTLRNLEDAMKSARYAMRSQTGHPYKQAQGASSPYPPQVRTEPESAGVFGSPLRRFLLRAGAIACEFTGGVVVFGAAFMVIIGMFYGLLEDSSYIAPLVGVGIPFLLGGGLLTWLGLRISGRLRRFRKYRMVIGSREFCTVKELAERTGRDERFLVKDLQRMVEHRLFLQGHLDRQETTFMLTDAVYDQYLKSEREEQRRRQEQERRLLQEEKQRRENPGESPEVKEALAQSREYVRQFRILNDQIPGTAVSARLDQIERLTAGILDHVEKNPDKLERIRQLTGYYLPTVYKLVETYARLESHPQDSDSVRQVRREIEETLETIEEAFSNLYDDLLEEEVLDIQSDISVLETMFAREGLTEDELDIELRADDKPTRTG